MIASYYKMLPNLRRLAIFGTLPIRTAFLPLCFSRVFAGRFGYISVPGTSILVPAVILAGIRSAKLRQQIIIACLGALVCTYYVREDRQILSVWTTAGEIAARTEAARELYPHPPAGAVLVFAGVPRAMAGGQGQVTIFQSGLADR